MEKMDIKKLLVNELIDLISNKGEKKYKSEQILKWIYQLQSDSFFEMTNLNKKLKFFLDENFFIERLYAKNVMFSYDSSTKYLFKLSDDKTIESLSMPEKKHVTLCLSSQVGCAYNCSFCMTSQKRLIRNLKFYEILSQVRDIKYNLFGKKNIKKKPPLNIVFMGMGEPLSNYTQLIIALDIILNSKYGLKFSSRRITISTAGFIPSLKLLYNKLIFNLAISINYTHNKGRIVLMPINKKYPIEDLVKTCKLLPLKNRQKITFEYILIKNLNDRIVDARRLAHILKGTKSKINLIPLNENKFKKYKKTFFKRILKFQEILIKKKYTTTIRYSKGSDICGACGQLTTKSAQ